jgi:hypothetical protein
VPIKPNLAFFVSPDNLPEGSIAMLVEAKAEFFTKSLRFM